MKVVAAFWLLVAWGVTSAETLVPARLDWADLRRLSVLAAAPVTRIPVRVGESVSAGDLLLETDATVLRAELAAARAAVEEERIRLAEAEREYERNRELYDRTVLSQHDLQLAEADWKAARRRFAQVQAELRRREQAMARSRILAPVAGRVVALHARVGEMIQTTLQARPLVELAAADAMVVVFAWDRAALPPERVQVRLPAGGERPARCRIDGLRGDHLALRCRFGIATAEEAARLWAGMPVEVRVP